MTTPPDGFHLSPQVSALLRLEGAAVFVAAVALYAAGDNSWILFAVLILAPDLAMIGYRAGPAVGATAYNLAHWYLVPALVAGAGLWAASDTAIAIALIWAAHIGIDRALGFGLKLPSGFRHTHLGSMGVR